MPRRKKSNIRNFLAKKRAMEFKTPQPPSESSVSSRSSSLICFDPESTTVRTRSQVKRDAQKPIQIALPEFVPYDVDGWNRSALQVEENPEEQCPETTVSVPSNTASTEFLATDAPGGVRKRGRPRKYAVAIPDNKKLDQALTTEASDNESNARTRGRPKKKPQRGGRPKKDADKEAPKNSASTEFSTTDKPGGARKRGRPRKYAVAIPGNERLDKASTTEACESKARPRGRPRKNPQRDAAKGEGAPENCSTSKIASSDLLDTRYPRRTLSQQTPAPLPLSQISNSSAQTEESEFCCDPNCYSCSTAKRFGFSDPGVYLGNENPHFDMEFEEIQLLQVSEDDL